MAKTAAWTRSEGKNKTGGLNAKGVASYRAANPGSKLQTAVTTKPSKLKAGSKDAKRRKVQTQNQKYKPRMKSTSLRAKSTSRECKVQA